MPIYQCKIKPNFVNICICDVITGFIRLLEDQSNISFQALIRTFSEDFLENAFGNMLESVYDEIYKDSERIEEKDRIHYFYLVSFGLGLARYKYYAAKKKSDHPNQVHKT